MRPKSWNSSVRGQVQLLLVSWTLRVPRKKFGKSDTVRKKNYHYKDLLVDNVYYVSRSQCELMYWIPQPITASEVVG